MSGGGRGAMTLNFSEIVGFSEIFLLRRKIVGILLLVTINVSNFLSVNL